MTEPTSPDAETVDTTDGSRDPLTTDEGLAAVAEQMPAVDEKRIAGDTQQLQPAPAPGLDVDNNGTDPVADLARPGDTQEV